MRKNNITLTSKNIISFFRNITSHFTGKEKIITLVSLIIMLSFSNITLCSSNIFNSSNVSALSYQSNVGLSFTFNPTLSVNISPSNLTIDSLTPGTTSDSNAINASVATNAAYGYTLSAIMNGDNSNLTHTNGANAFSSIATDASLSNLTTDNTWGYSYKNNLASTPTWSSYSGLSNSASKVLFNTDSNSNGSIDFKIAAKASDTQPSGAYTGTINFTAVTKPTPMNLSESYFAAGKTRHNGYYAMQDMTSEICNNTEVIGEGSQTQLIDLRDDKVYWATKLADGHCWMTQNLDLNLSHDRPLTSEDTDLNDNSLSGAYSENYKYNPTTKTITWTPANTTRDYANNTGTAWSNNNNTAYSLNPGEWYWNGNDDTLSCNYLDDVCEDFSRALYDATGAHSHVGNYYNWSAAIASDNSYLITINTQSDIKNNPQNSICSKNWRLPTISNESSSVANSTNEFGRLNSIYNEGRLGTDIGLIMDPLFFVRFGLFLSAKLSGAGYEANYWASTVYNGSLAYYFNFRNNYVFTNSMNDYSHSRNLGGSVRCLAR